MQVACYNVHERLMPTLRAATARGLRAKGMTQDRIAEHLGVSQAMVSRYLRAATTSTPPVRETLVRRVVASSVEKTLADEDVGRVGLHCTICTALSGEGVYCAVSSAELVEQCLRHDRPASARERATVLMSLRQAETKLRQIDLRPLQPAVRINLAAALADATDARDVASFPGRLVDLKGQVRAVSDPEFGASTHLAQLLLRLRKARPELAAILNLRHDASVRRSAEAAGLVLHPVRRKGEDLAPPRLASGKVDGLVDPGAFGIEPILYLVGTSPADVLDKAQRVRAKYKSTR